MTEILNNYLEQIYNTVDVIKRVNVACGIIFKEQKGEKPALLLIQRDKEDHFPLHYETPRGKCDKGENEDLLSCLKREVKEEVGIDIIPLKFIDKFQYTADKGTRLSTQYNFLCKMKDPNQQVKISKEHQDVKWVTSLGEVELMVLPELKKSIAKAFTLIDSEGQISNIPLNNFTPSGMIEEINTADVVGGVAGATLGWSIGHIMVKRQCKKLYPDDAVKQKKCYNSPIWKRKGL